MTLPDHPLFDNALRLTLAFVLVLPVGWERERHARSAGLRTYPLVSLATCAFILFWLRGEAGPSEQADASYGVLTGIGFVGTGAIVKSPHHVRGVTTAVTLWVSGAIGVACAFDVPLIAAALALMSVVTLWVPSFPARRRASR